jgi:hypothetical protein
MKDDVTDLELKKSNWDTSGRSKTRARRRDLKGAAAAVNTGTFPTEAPSSIQYFRRDWRQRCKDAQDQYKYLHLCGAATLAKLFAPEIPDGLLGPFLFALNKGYVASDAAATQSILDGLATTGRYSLSLDFMTSEEEVAQKELLAKLSGGESVGVQGTGSVGGGGEADAEPATAAEESVVAPKSSKITIVDVIGPAEYDAATGDEGEVGSNDSSDDDSLPPLEEVDLSTGAVSPTPAAPAGLLEGGALESMVNEASGTPRRLQIASDDEADSDDED